MYVYANIDIIQFLESFLNENQRLRLVVRMNGLYRAVMGNPTGFYTLDLGSTQGRTTAVKVSQRVAAENQGWPDNTQSVRGPEVHGWVNEARGIDGIFVLSYYAYIYIHTLR